MSTEVKFERVDGKDEAAFSNKPLVIKNPAKGTLIEGDVLTGTFKKKVISETYGSASYILETETEDILVNGCGSLNKQMENVAAGELIQIEYRGSQAMKDGKFKGKLSHLYTVRRAVNSEEAAG